MAAGDQDNLAGLKVSALTVIGWIAALSTISIWLGWGWLSSRIDGLESGRTTPMSHITAAKIEAINLARDYNAERIRQLNDRIEKLELRLQFDEAEIYEKARGKTQH